MLYIGTECLINYGIHYCYFNGVPKPVCDKKLGKIPDLLQKLLKWNYLVINQEHPEINVWIPLEFSETDAQFINEAAHSESIFIKLVRRKKSQQLQFL